MFKDPLELIYLIVLAVEIGAAVAGGIFFFNKKTNTLPKIVTMAIVSLCMGRFYALLVYYLMDINLNSFSLGFLGYLGFYLFMVTNYSGIKFMSIDHPSDSCAKKKKKILPRLLALILPLLLGFMAFIGCVGEGTAKYIINTVVMTIPAVFILYNASLNAITTKSGWRRTAHISELIIIILIQIQIQSLEYGDGQIYGSYIVEAILCWLIIISVRRERKRFE